MNASEDVQIALRIYAATYKVAGYAERHKQLSNAADQLAFLESENVRLKADSDRLDWLQLKSYVKIESINAVSTSAIGEHSIAKTFLMSTRNQQFSPTTSIRSAIDNAMNADQSKA